MGENFVLFLFLILPPLLLLATRRFFKRMKEAPEKRRGLALVGGNLLIFVFLMSVAMLAGECYYRFFYDSTDSFALCKTTQRWFDRHFQRNLTGFRDSFNYLPNVEPGKRRISFIGDSFTVGHGIKDVEDRFANRIRAVSPEYEVHVLAECGLDTDRQLELISFLPRSGYESDVVVLVYCLNDISDITPGWQNVLDRIYKGRAPGFFATHSYLFNTLSARRHMSQVAEVADYYGFITDAYGSDVWDKQQQRLIRMHEEITEAGGELLVVTFPFLHSLGENYPYRAVHDQLDEFWTSRGVPHLDLLPTFADGSPEELTVNARDVHPNEAAHQMAAEAIAPFLTEQVTAAADRPAGPEALSAP